MSKYFIESFKIDKLWGYQDINLNFERDVNILIGPNASGKTTILNLLHSILLADFPTLLNVEFNQIEIKLKEFEGKSVRTVKVETTDESLKFSVGQIKFDVDKDSIYDRRYPGYYMDHRIGKVITRTPHRHITRKRILPENLYDEITALVPIVWLPVSRRLPITGDEEEQQTMMVPLESVDLRLQELLADLSHYHTRLNAQLSERYKNFEHQVLSVILYSKEHDLIESAISLSPPTSIEEYKDQLLGAFNAAGLLDDQMQIRIDEHFVIAEEVLKRSRKNENDEFVFGLEDLFVLPLIRRTQLMVEYAEELEKDREHIFKPLRCYEGIVNSFLDKKNIKVDEDGKLKIESLSHPDLNPRLLSSGEKQILILLTEALLKVDEPVVYIADEPELSLHVSWQEKLLESLVSLGGNIQTIVATHSPDIVGKFEDNVIDLGVDG